ncbi:DUF317 domain-containing protein [Kitasatospora sp. NPDC098663]|uniref:DUF317 domain-containing protein n=1 Tax=Kitasatospora sp. NPDC098663 TaxID=3364096 RepID=UPI00380E81FE
MWNSLARRGWTTVDDGLSITSRCGRVSIAQTTEDEQEIWRIQARREPAQQQAWQIDISRTTPAEIVAESAGRLADELARHGAKALQGPGPATPLRRALDRHDWFLDEVFGNSIAVYGSPGEGLDIVQLYQYRLGRNENLQDPDRIAFHLQGGQQPQAFDPTYQGWSIGFHGPVPHILVVHALEAACNPAAVTRSPDQVPPLHRESVRLDTRAQAATTSTRAGDGTFRPTIQQTVAPTPPSPNRRTR